MPTNISSFSLRFPDVRLLPPAPPYTYLGVAHNMIAGVRVLADATPTPNLALALVAAHVLECTLKAYLSRGGSDSLVVAHDIRHNLCSLWSLSHIHGLGIPAAIPSWATALGQVHGAPYYLRYSTGVHGISLPGPEPMATELKSLLDLVQASIS